METINYSLSEHGNLPKSPKYERAHTLGQGTGSESPFAVYYAPSFVNQQLQNNGIESFMRSLVADQPQNASYKLITETASHPGSQRLSHINYRVEVIVDGKPQQFFEYTINVAGTAEHPQIMASPISFANNSTAQAYRRRVPIPDILLQNVNKAL